MLFIGHLENIFNWHSKTEGPSFDWMASLSRPDNKTSSEGSNGGVGVNRSCKEFIITLPKQAVIVVNWPVLQRNRIVNLYYKVDSKGLIERANLVCLRVYGVLISINLLLHLVKVKRGPWLWNLFLAETGRYYLQRFSKFLTLFIVPVHEPRQDARFLRFSTARHLADAKVYV